MSSLEGDTYSDVNGADSIAHLPLNYVLTDTRSINVCPTQRLRYLSELRERFIAGALHPKLISEMIQHSTYLCDWQLLIELEKQYSNTKPKDKIQLAYAYWKLGQKPIAYHCLQQLMLLYPDNNHLFALHQQLRKYDSNQFTPTYFNQQVSEVLSLVPLDAHHCNEFLWQYWDPKIAIYCCMPTIHTPEQWYEWFAEQQRFSDQRQFAIYHQHWGFVGMISLIQHANAGFVYYWIGKDFQQQGLATQAVALLLQMATTWYQLTHCYAKVLGHNIGSHRTLAKNGFRKMSVKAAAPDGDEIFYFWAEDKTEYRCQQELATLLVKMDSDVLLEMPISAQLVQQGTNTGVNKFRSV